MTAVRVHGGTEGGRMVAVTGTAIVWIGLLGWLDALDALAARSRPCARHYSRAAALYRSLRIDDIRRCRATPTLQRAERTFDALRRRCGEPDATPTPIELGRPWAAALLIETRNHLQRLALGRPDGPRRKGPRFDPTRLPDDRLLVLLQRTSDPDRRFRLDAERRRRQATHPIDRHGAPS